MSDRKPTKREKWEARRKAKEKMWGEIRQCYREHTPPQVRQLRFLKRVGQA